jgi:sugar phosphate permease
MQGSAVEETATARTNRKSDHLSNPPKNGNRLFYGWWIVAASSFYNLLVNGSFYIGFTAFFDPLRREFGWTSAQTALGVSLQRLESAAAAPLIGLIFDRVGPRKIILPGMIVAGGGLVMMSDVQSLGWYYAAFLTIAVGLSVSWLGPPMYTVSNWFIRKRSSALAILMAGSGLGGLLVPLLVLLIDRVGWRTSIMTVGIVYIAVSVPLAVLLKHRPEDHGMLPDGDAPGGADTAPHDFPPASENSPGDNTGRTEINFGLREAVGTRAFWLISLSLTLSQFVMTAVFVLEMPHLENIGISREVAGVTVTFTTLISLAGSLLGGFLGDTLKKTHLLAAAIALQSLGLMILANIHQTWHLAPFLLIYGIGFGATVPLRPALIADYFGRINIGAILGLVMSIILLGSVLSPLVAGWFCDVYGNYRGIFSIYAVALLTGAPAVLAARRPATEPGSS